jgi:NAD(P)-dependent dehydrogenase (short-subunit alcohol dehydrogenase family)
MTGRFAGKVAVITGGARGLGGATARLLVAEGGQVVLADLEDDAGKSLAAELGDGATYVHCDVTVESDVEAAINAATDRFGRLDAVFANAGISGSTASITELSMDDFDTVIAINLRGVVATVKHAARVLRSQGTGGAIVMTSSCAGLIGGTSPHAYTASKAAVVGLARSLSAELISERIRVNAIAPGTIPTPMTYMSITGGVSESNIAQATDTIANDWSPTGQAPDPSVIAEAFLFLAGESGTYVSGATLPVDGGLANGSPPAGRSAPGASQFGRG